MRLLLIDDDSLEFRLLTLRLSGLAVELRHRDAVPEPDALSGAAAPHVVMLDHDVPPHGNLYDNERALRARGFRGRVVCYTSLDPAALPGLMPPDAPYISKDLAERALRSTIEAWLAAEAPQAVVIASAAPEEWPSG